MEFSTLGKLARLTRRLQPDVATIGAILRLRNAVRSRLASPVPGIIHLEYGGFACDPITCKCQAPYVASSDPFSIDCVTPSDASVLSKCGDGRVALLREECDPQVELHCTDDCKCEDFYIPTPFGTCKPLIHCGNGVLETNMGEECDAWWDPGCSTATCKCDIAEGYYARGVRELFESNTSNFA